MSQKKFVCAKNIVKIQIYLKKNLIYVINFAMRLGRQKILALRKMDLFE